MYQNDQTEMMGVFWLFCLGVGVKEIHMYMRTLIHRSFVCYIPGSWNKEII